MGEITPPPTTIDDRYLSCQEAIDDRFAALVSDAVAAGWTFEEVMVALIELADNNMLANRGRADTDAVVAMMRRMT